jgi:hypothetical protein
MLTYVINLDSRPDRWTSIQKAFAGSNLQLERISAVKKSNGSYGNILSFIKALKLAKKMRLANVLIMEDDCKPRPGWARRWRLIRQWLDVNPDAWDIYSGGAWQIVAPRKIAAFDGITIYDPLWAVSSHWLYIPERSYDKLLEHYIQASHLTKYVGLLGIDVHNNLFKTVTSYPFLAYQASGYSNISQKSRNVETMFGNAESRLAAQSSGWRRRSRRRTVRNNHKSQKRARTRKN